MRRHVFGSEDGRFCFRVSMRACAPCLPALALRVPVVLFRPPLARMPGGRLPCLSDGSAADAAANEAGVAMPKHAGFVLYGCPRESTQFASRASSAAMTLGIDDAEVITDLSLATVSAICKFHDHDLESHERCC